MKKVLFAMALGATVLAACTKKSTNVTNNTIVMVEPKPAFTVSGLQDVTLINGTSLSGVYITINVQYNDSAQQRVSLSLSPLPAGVAIDTNWVTTGYPTFSTTIVFFDTTAAGATPGTFPMVLTATTDSGTKRFPFNITVRPIPSCTGTAVGKYNSCYGCAGIYYTDSVYNDPSVKNRIWFTNFNNSGNKVYGNVICSTMSVQVPTQTVGGVTYSGYGSISSGHHIYVNMTTPSSSCTVSMN